MSSAPRSAPVGPTLSAVLIVKDEEQVLLACLDALRGAVDEVVVYDTGSSDSTRDIARAAGAVVVEGFWDHHFGHARNRALEHATCDWVLSVDADEVLTGDRAALRRTCSRAPGGLARVTIASPTSGTGPAPSPTRPLRLFRREAFTWVGALHEHLVAVAGAPGDAGAPVAPDCHLQHSGYDASAVSHRDKAARNLSIAEAALAALPRSGDDPAPVWDAYGRSLAMSGRTEEALEALGRVLRLRPDPSVVLQSGRAAMACMRELDDYRGAEPWLEAMERCGEPAAVVATWRALAALAARDADGAARHLDDAEGAPSADPSGAPVVLPADLDVLRADVVRCAGRPAEAVRLHLERLRQDPHGTPLEALVAAAGDAGLDITALARDVPEASLDRSVTEAVLLPQPYGDQWLRGVVGRCPDQLEPVVAGTLVASRSDLETAISWSSTARGAGLAHLCPLRAIGDDAGRTAVERVLAWSLVAGITEDTDSRPRLAALLADLSAEELVEAVGPAAELVPSVVDVLAAAVDAALAAQDRAVV